MQEAPFAITTTVRSYPTLPYEQIKNDVLGTRYYLSLVFIGARRARTLNQRYRNKSYVPNVLAFPLDAAHGEIFITPEVAARECSKWEMTVRQYVGYLFIHAVLHLKGHTHGATMKRVEKQYVDKYLR